MPILIVDDNAQNLKLARVALECEGFVVRTAGDGEAAMELARTAHPRLILMDIQLPGLDGLEVTRRLKADVATRGLKPRSYVAIVERPEEIAVGAEGLTETESLHVIEGTW